jgi:hypothetical protein
MTEQEFPDGQHSTVVLAASTTQLLPDGQQKLDGRFELHCEDVESAQVEARSNILCPDSAAVVVARQAEVSRTSKVRTRLIVLLGRQDRTLPDLLSLFKYPRCRCRCSVLVRRYARRRKRYERNIKPRKQNDQTGRKYKADDLDGRESRMKEKGI